MFVYASRFGGAVRATCAQRDPQLDFEVLQGSLVVTETPDESDLAKATDLAGWVLQPAAPVKEGESPADATFERRRN